MLIQGSHKSGTFEWINSYEYRNPIITVQREKSNSPFHVLQSVMTECQCVYVVSKIHRLLSVQIMSVLVCSFVLILKAWLLMRLKLPSITASSFFSASTTRLYSSMFFTLILSPSITTLRGTPFAALCITCFSSINQAVHLWSQTNELRNAMSVVLVLEDGSRQLLVEVEERFQ